MHEASAEESDIHLTFVGMKHPKTISFKMNSFGQILLCIDGMNAFIYI
jgi:hypothetical protein